MTEFNQMETQTASSSSSSSSSSSNNALIEEIAYLKSLVTLREKQLLHQKKKNEELKKDLQTFITQHNVSVDVLNDKKKELTEIQKKLKAMQDGFNALKQEQKEKEENTQHMIDDIKASNMFLLHKMQKLWNVIDIQCRVNRLKRTHALNSDGQYDRVMELCNDSTILKDYKRVNSIRNYLCHSTTVSQIEDFMGQRNYTVITETVKHVDKKLSNNSLL